MNKPINFDPDCPLCEAGVDRGEPHVMGKVAMDAEPTDESIAAQRDALAAALRDVLRLIDRKAFLWPVDQDVVNKAEATLVEAERK